MGTSYGCCGAGSRHRKMLVALLLATGSEAWRSAFETRYDAVVLGSGLKESLLSGLLASRGKRVLHLVGDAPGGDSQSVDMESLYERLVGPGSEVDAKLGSASDYSVDLTPKVSAEKQHNMHQTPALIAQSSVVLHSSKSVTRVVNCRW